MGAGIYGETGRCPAIAGKVFRKCGSREEGRMRVMILKWGEIRDLEIYGLTRGEWERMRRAVLPSDGEMEM